MSSEDTNLPSCFIRHPDCISRSPARSTRVDFPPGWLVMNYSHPPPGTSLHPRHQNKDQESVSRFQHHTASKKFRRGASECNALSPGVQLSWHDKHQSMRCGTQPRPANSRTVEVMTQPLSGAAGRFLPPSRKPSQPKRAHFIVQVQQTPGPRR